MDTKTEAQKAVHAKIVESDRQRREGIDTQMEVFDLFVTTETARLAVEFAAVRQLSIRRAP